MEVIQVTDTNEIENLLLRYKGNLLYTNRISMDPFFSRELSVNRYLPWKKDMLNYGCKLLEIVIKDKRISFFIVKKIDTKIVYPVLAGL